jgi:TonB-dependent starch-binding outer membrane protein SusC
MTTNFNSGILPEKTSRFKKLTKLLLLISILSLMGSVKDSQIIANEVETRAVLQQREIKGTVTGSDNIPLPGVTVMVKGTTTGTITNVDGQYSIYAPPDATLVFSFVGMLTQEIDISNQAIINITLQETAIGLEEVVAIGFGTQRKRDISTAISSVSRESLDDRSSASFTRAIAGEMAGVRILNSNNAPGGGTNIRIRGVSSIHATNNPLIVIDGFPLKDGFNQNENPLNSLNPNDIESIEVLKDASSSAIYGAQAANGVILITTKRGKAGVKPTFSVDVSHGMEMMINPMDMLNREDFLQYMDDARAQAYIVEDPNFGTNNPNASLWSWSDSDETRIYNWRNFSSMADAMSSPGSLYERWAHVTPETKAQQHNTNWQDVVTHVGQVRNIQLSTSGGTDDVTYMISGGHYHQDGILSATGYNRFSFRSNIEFKINNRIRTGLLLAPSLENLDVAEVENTFHDIVRTPPLYPAYDENGDRAFLGLRAAVLPAGEDWTQWNLVNLVNPLERDRVSDNRRTLRNIGTLFGEAEIIKGLTFRSELHTEFRNWERNYFLPSAYPTSNIVTTTRSRGINELTSRFYWNTQSFLTYNRTFGEHSLNAMLGYTAQESSYRSTYISKHDYPSDHIPTLNQALTILSSQNDARTNRSSESDIGAFARTMYNYSGKYYLTASVRRDGSSKFGADRKWGVFPSFSLAWRLSDEPFFSPFAEYVNDLKIRGGWGIIGNSGIGNYNALSTLSGTSYVLGTGSAAAAGYQDGRVSNSLLGWETTTDYGVGIDAALLDYRISLSVDYFYKLTEDMLFSMPLPAITGFNSYMVNIGSMRNRGFEYFVRTRNFIGGFNWSTTFNLSYYRNRVLDTGKDKRPLISTDSYTVEGRPLAGLYGYQTLGPYRDWEDVKTNPIRNANNPDWMWRSAPGTTKLYDINGDGIIDDSDRTIIGSPNPNFIWGMTNNFSYKGIDLSVQVTGVQGGDILNTRLEPIMARSDGTANINYEYFNNYWRPDRPDAKYAAPTRKSWDGTPNRGTLLFKQTYFNIQNIAIGYTLPGNITQRMDMNRVRIYTSIQNAAMFSRYPGYNPEVNAAGSSALSQAVDGGAYPLTRIVSFGLNVSL